MAAVVGKRWSILARSLTFLFFKVVVHISRFRGLSKAETKEILRDDDVLDSVERSILDIHVSILEAIKKWRKKER